ncbi:MAG TPA: hypothetical protein VFY89_08610, partial [Ktedonobacterales bacterium]
MRRYGWRAGIGLLLLATMLLAGCDSPTTLSEQAVLKRATPTATPTPTPRPSPPPTPTPQPCGVDSPALTVGDLAVQIMLSGLAFPGRKLPDGLALKPYQLPAAPGPALDQKLPLAPAVNPSVSEPFGGYVLYVCNTSASQAHVLNAIALQIVSMTP